MFSCELSEGIVLKKIIDAIKDVVNQVTLEITPEGMGFQAMDMSHVALVQLTLKSDEFTSFKTHKNHSLGIKLQSLHKILKCANLNDTIALECDEDPSQLLIKFESPKHERFCKFFLSLTIQDEDSLQIPNTVYSNQITLSSSEFSRIVRELQQISESVRIETSKKGVKFVVEGEVAKGEIELRENNSNDENERVTIDVDQPLVQSFSLVFLSQFCKAAALSNAVKLYLSENTPLVLEFKIGSLGDLRYYLAPKLEENQ